MPAHRKLTYCSHAYSSHAAHMLITCCSHTAHMVLICCSHAAHILLTWCSYAAHMPALMKLTYCSHACSLHAAYACCSQACFSHAAHIHNILDNSDQVHPLSIGEKSIDLYFVITIAQCSVVYDAYNSFIIGFDEFVFLISSRRIYRTRCRGAPVAPPSHPRPRPVRLAPPPSRPRPTRDD